MSVNDRLIASELVKHEAVIERGMRTTIEVGMAMKAIRDHKLYQGQYESFESYVKNRWECSRPRAYQLIEAAEVDAHLSTIVDKSERPQNESQLREVAKAPVEQQAEVVKKAVEKAAEENRKPTAKDYQQAVKQVVGEIVYDNVEPEKPTNVSTDEQIKTERKKAKSYAEYLQRTIDDLNHIKRNKVLHPELIKLCGKILEGLERW
jgi:hypothetical protein